MATTTELQYKQLERMIANLDFAIPVHVRRRDDGAIQIDAGNPYVIDDSDSMDSFLNDLMDIDGSLEGDETLDEFLTMLDPYCEY
ncbi:hypothetical protein LOC67_22950 [Stieleria sp. JC731]|uniref:hypothetical protein n=1 Tax=Pirellulaceae TaxID=2691357 RepID=UPI001E2E4C46|nr:hypothetical protein [Stieleria sp. JC731]MCC9603417.1 hypothetical protein [Stieleria sp. JC731]